MTEKERQNDRIIYWLGQRDMIANIFMLLRTEDAKKVLDGIAVLYNNQCGGKEDPNPHVEDWIKKNK